MKDASRFTRFLENIGLDQTREGRIRSAIAHLAGFVQNDRPILDVFIELIQQGSWALGTANRPQKEGEEFDLDLVLLLNIKLLPYDRQTPERVIAWIAERLRADESYKGKVAIRKRCVRVSYAGDFHMDVVPAQPVAEGSNSPIQVPDREIGQWIVSDPVGYGGWFARVDRSCGRKLPEVVRAGKHWQATKVGDRSRLCSMGISTLLGQNLATGLGSTPETFVATLEQLAAHLDKHATTPIIQNPTLPLENLARDWGHEPFIVFRDKLRWAALKAREALNEEVEDRSVELWREVLGDAYPLLAKDAEDKVIQEAQEVSDASRAGKLYVTSTGAVKIGAPGGNAVRAPHSRDHGGRRR